MFVLDEAGMVGSAQMSRFTSAVEAAGAKLILLGDARQLQPIEAGAAFRAIAEDAGYIELTGVRRHSVPSQPFIPAVTTWAESVETVVAKRIKDHPMFRSTLAQLVKAASPGWIEPEKATLGLRQEYERKGSQVHEVIVQLREHPERSVSSKAALASSVAKTPLGPARLMLWR